MQRLAYISPEGRKESPVELLQLLTWLPSSFSTPAPVRTTRSIPYSVVALSILGNELISRPTEITVDGM